MPPDQVWTLDHEGRRAPRRRGPQRLAPRAVVRRRGPPGAAEDEVGQGDPRGGGRAGQAPRLLLRRSARRGGRRSIPTATTSPRSSGLGGLDLVPEPGSAAERYDDKLRDHPNRYAGLAALGGVAKVLVPILLTFVRCTSRSTSPGHTCPSRTCRRSRGRRARSRTCRTGSVPDEVWWVLDKAKYVWPVVRRLRDRPGRDQAAPGPAAPSRRRTTRPTWSWVRCWRRDRAQRPGR